MLNCESWYLTKATHHQLCCSLAASNPTSSSNFWLSRASRFNGLVETSESMVCFYHQRDFPWFPDEFSSSIGPFSSADGCFSPRQLMSGQQGLQGEATAPS